jgi:hypothetical protein
MDIGVHQCRFVSPVDFSTFGLGAGFDRWIVLVQPRLYSLGALFVSTTDRLLWREAPALQVIPNTPNRQLDAVFTANQLGDRRPESQYQ